MKISLSPTFLLSASCLCTSTTNAFSPSGSHTFQSKTLQQPSSSSRSRSNTDTNRICSSSNIHNSSRGITAAAAHKEKHTEFTPTPTTLPLAQQVSTVLQQSTKQAHKILTTTILATTLLLASASTLPANAGSASDYGALSDEQKAVAEAWRIVDNNFIDRTFNHQDWFKVRQEAVKKKYKTMGEAQVEIERLVGTLGDKYTRYLPPAKYRSMVDSATGTLAGVGVEISFSADRESGKIIVADTEPTSPASIGTY